MTAATPAQPAPASLRADLEETLANWRDDAVYRPTDTRDEMSEHCGVTACADTLAGILADHPGTEPLPASASPHLECAVCASGVTAPHGAGGTPGQALPEVLRAEFLRFLASQGYDDQGRFDHDEMELAFETGWQIAQAAAAQQPSAAAISAWIEDNPREFSTWLATQRQLGGVTPATAAQEPHAAPGLLTALQDDLQMLRDDLADAEDRLARWPKCPAGCSCRIGTDDADDSECGCDGPCTTGWEPKPAPELATAMAERDQARADRNAARNVVAEMLDSFSPTGSARVGMVQIARWRTRSGLTS